MTTRVKSRGGGTARLLVGYGAVLGAMPYLTLKLAWLSGSTVGITDRAMAEDGSLFVLNAVTAVMDLVAITVALAFTHEWGRRVPAWLVLGPMWIGTGLLAPIAVGLPVVGAGELFSAGGGAAGPDDFLASWVRPLVYGGFAWQGVLLCTAFVLYARTRWAHLFTVRTADVRPGATRPVQVVLAGGSAVLLVGIAALHLTHAFGGTVGLSAAAAAARDTSTYLVAGMSGLLALLAAGGILAMVHGLGARRPFWLPLSLTWVGAGATFAWGLWGTTNTLASTALTRGGEAMPLTDLHAFAKVLAGLVVGLTALMLLAEQRRDTR